MTKAVIFDLWGTIIENGVHPSPSKQVRFFLRTRIPFSEFITTFEDTFMTKKYESLKAGFEQVVADFNLKIPEFVYEKLVGTWNKNAILSKMYDETDEVLKTLKKKKIKIFLLANTDQFTLEQLENKFKLSEYFDKIYPSCETGLLKINPKAFEHILEDNKLTKKDIIMVGDCLVSDIATAEKAGIKPYLVDRNNRREYENKVTNLKDLLALFE